MKSSALRQWGRFLFKSSLFLLVTSLPVIPISRSPVTPHSTEKTDFIALWQLVIVFTHLLGVRVRITAGTIAVTIGLILASVAVYRLIEIKQTRSSRQKGDSRPPKL